MSLNNEYCSLRLLATLPLVLLVAGCQPELYERPAGESAFTAPYGNAVSTNIEVQRAGLTDRASRGTTTLNGVFQSEVEAFIDFRRDSYAIWPDMIPQFAKQAEWLRANPGTSIRVLGRGDRGNVDAADRELAMRRARASADYYEILGISADRLVVGIEPDLSGDQPILASVPDVPVVPVPQYVEPVIVAPTQGPTQPALADLIYVDEVAPAPIYDTVEYTVVSEPELLPPVAVAPTYVETVDPTLGSTDVVPPSAIYSAPVEVVDYTTIEPLYVETPPNAALYAETAGPILYAEQPAPVQPVVAEPISTDGYRGALYGGIRLIAFKRPGLDGNRAALQNRRYITDAVDPPADISTGATLGGGSGG